MARTVKRRKPKEGVSPNDARQRAELGERLRSARTGGGLTQEALARQVGRQKNWLSDIERGRRGIDPHTLQRIATILERSIELFTNPSYEDERREELVRPATREDWELLYEGESERAAAHASLDEAFERARRLVGKGRSVGKGGTKRKKRW